MIIPMKKAHIVVLKEDKERLLKSLQRYGEMMIIPQSENNIDTALEDALVQRTEKSLKFLKKFEKKQKFIRDEQIVDYDFFINYNPKQLVLLDKIEKSEELILKLQSEIDSIEESILFLMPFNNLDIKLSSLSKTKYAYIHVGFVEIRNLNNLISVINEYGGIVKLLNKSKDGQALVFSNYYEDNEEIIDKIKSFNYLEVALPHVDQLVVDLINEKQEIVLKNKTMIEKLQNELKDLSDQMNELKVFNDQLMSKSELKKVSVKQTIETIYLEGWIRSDRIDRFKKSINEATDTYDLDIADPLPDEVPPTSMINSKFVEPFESITDMFSRPKPNEVDPNPIMSIWYWVLFGIMMGDAGYGLLMAILFFVLIKVKKPKGNGLKLMRVLLYSSVTTIIWGVLFGSYFGATWDPLKEIGNVFGLKLRSIALLPMDQPLEMLILSIVIGALHIITGILMKAYTNFLNKNYFAMIVDQFSWLSVLIGIGMLFIPSLKSIGTILIIVGAIIVVLTAGRSKKNIFGKAVSGILSLYAVTGYISDILSYSRILALSLSSAVIAMVMNMLAGMIQGSVIGFIFSILIYIVGHLFNIVMGLLSAYVHDSRLQYIEFFNKFYEGGGYEFQPLSVKLKYVDAISDKENI